MQGIEAEILNGFKKYLKRMYRIDLMIVWKEARDFGDIYATIRDKKLDATIGASAFSVTPERQQYVGFSPPYMSDISVLISSKNIPIAQSMEEFSRVFSRLTAVTIRETTYEQDLLKLKNAANLSFGIQYIPSSQNILHTIEKMDSAFGFIDLPVYMMIFNDNPSVGVKRQNLFPVKRQGYSFIYPPSSDWASPFEEYYYDENFKTELERIIARYIDIELYHFIESLAIQSNDPVVLLTKEKEIQDRDLLGKSQLILQQIRARNFLIVFAAMILVFLIIIIILYRKRMEQKQKIEAQGKSIESKNEQLEKRNHHLMTLDEEKNNLIKILAHDMRTPINHVQGLAQVFLLSNEGLPEDQKMIIQNITDASIRLNRMITNILDIDAIENDRVKIFMDDVRINPLIQQVIKTFHGQAQKKNLHISFTSSVENVLVKGDPLFLIQIFENLLSNAIKFSENGKTIEVIVTGSGEKVSISMKDQGPGLTEEDFHELFKKFKRLSAKPTAGENSTGLGLSIVKKYVELMGGRVWCESKPNQGAAFTVELNKG